MKKLEKMTRRELAELIIDNSIKRGIIKAKNRELQINARLNGYGLVKPMGWVALYNTALCITMGYNHRAIEL